MPYSDLPPELLLHIASFLVADYDTGLCWAYYPEPYTCLAWLSSWIQTSKSHAELLTPQLYDRGLRFLPRRKTTEANAAPWQECRWFTPIITPCPLERRLYDVARHWKSDILTSYLLGRIHQGLWPVGESYQICLLTFMVKAGNIAMLETLIALGDLQGRFPQLGHLDTVTPLNMAIMTDNLAAMRVLLDAGADINQRSQYGLLPLHVAASKSKSVEPINLLIQAGADIWATAANTSRTYPVESALDGGNERSHIARPLLDAMLDTENPAADPDWKERVLYTAILHSRLGSADIVQILVNNGADAFSRCTRQDDKTAIELVALYETEPRYIHPINDGTYRELHKIAAALFQAEPHLWPLGHINRRLWECMRGVDCVEQGQTMLFALLIQSGESALDVVGPNGFKALHYLCDPWLFSHPHYSLRTSYPASIHRMVSVLLDNGASVVARISHGQSPLLFATQMPCPVLLTLFLEKRPNCLIEDNALHGSMNSLPHETIPLSAAILRNDIEIVEMLLDHGADISIIDIDHLNMLCVLKPRMLEVLIKTTLAVPEHRREWGCSLVRAMETGNREVIDMLLEAGASPYGKTVYGYTALQYAAYCRDVKTLQILIQRWGPALVQSDDCPSGGLVCAVLCQAGFPPVRMTRDPELLKIAKSLVDNGAAVHEPCYVCGSWKEEFGIQMGAQVGMRSLTKNDDCGGADGS